MPPRPPPLFSGLSRPKLLARMCTLPECVGPSANTLIVRSVLQPNSPQAVVKTALQSANKSRLLARRLFYSFVRPGADHLVVSDIARFFPSAELAEHAFTIFDKDSNGDINRDEMEMACMCVWSFSACVLHKLNAITLHREIHREQLSIEHSMRDLDSAVGRLDNIFMSLYFVVAILIFAVMLDAQIATLITSASTLVLGMHNHCRVPTM